MRGTGGSQHGVTQIGFGSDAPSVEVDELYPMEISKSVPEEKDMDHGEYASSMVNKMSMRHRRRSMSTSSSVGNHYVSENNSKESISGRKRPSSEIQSFGGHHDEHTNPIKRHCATHAHHLQDDHNDIMMAVDDTPHHHHSSIHHGSMAETEPSPDHTARHHEGASPSKVELTQISALRDAHHRLSEQLSHHQLNERQLTAANSDLKRRLSEMTVRLNKQIQLTESYESERVRNERACDSLRDLMDRIAVSERQERDSKLAEDNKLIGRVVQCASNINNFTQIQDVWEDGQLFDDLKRRRKQLEAEKEDVESQKKELRKLKAKRQKESKENKENCQSMLSQTDGFLVPLQKPRPLMDRLSLDAEIVSIRLSNIKKQLAELDVEQTTLEYRKKIHIKFIRLTRDEKKSRFGINKMGECYLLNDRYVLTSLLGRGGFSEVHRAYDLLEHKYVAAKIHQLNSHWSDDRKRNYTKHATREYDIHKSLNHCNIVSLFDVFGIDVNSFCTVLEYCDGMDLDMYLKIHKRLHEKEARALILQVFIGLKYLHNQTKPGPIIHYDLKPGNLLYKDGRIKLTDFGLAKIMETERDSIELTSQGAGTYWYLPPECFRTATNGQSIYISPKVDIWSGGVILYQMLFGKRPFGDNMSQDSILSNKTILNAHQVHFPSQPKGVSPEAKDFMKQCLSYDPTLRLSSDEIVDVHPYFASFRKSYFR